MQEVLLFSFDVFRNEPKQTTTKQEETQSEASDTTKQARETRE